MWDIKKRALKVGRPTRSILFALLLGILLSIVFRILRFQAVESAVPKISIASSSNVGDWDGGVAYGAITVGNVGTAPLEIKDVILCCGSSLPQGFPKLVTSGSNVTFPVKVTTGTGDPRLVFRRNLVIKTNDSAFPERIIQITGRNETPIKPINPSLGILSSGDSITLHMVVLPNRVKWSDFNAFTCSPYLSLGQFRKEENNRVGLDIKLSPSTPRGLLRSYIFIDTHVFDYPYCVIPVSIIVESGVRFHPEVIYFSKPRYVKDEDRVVRLSVLDDKWRNLSVTTKYNQIHCTITPDGDQKYLLRCTLDPRSEAVSGVGSVEIEDGHGDVISIPVVW